MIPNPSHETQQSGRSSAKHARNERFDRQSYVITNRRRNNRTGKRKRVGSRTAVSDLPVKMQIEHYMTYVRAGKASRKTKKELASTDSESVKLDPYRPCVAPKLEKVDVQAELKVLIEHALSLPRTPRLKRRTVIKDGALHTVTEELPARKLETLKDFIEVFPSMREALERLATI